MRSLAAILVLLAAAPLTAAAKNEITISGTCFLLNGAPFPYTGISFYNAIYNPTFNKSSENRRQWIRKFQKYGINVLRVFSQWDMNRPWIDTCADCTLFQPDGRLRPARIARLKEILTDADSVGMVIQLEIFQHVSWGEGKLGATGSGAGQVD